MIIDLTSTQMKMIHDCIDLNKRTLEHVKELGQSIDEQDIKDMEELLIKIETAVTGGEYID